MSGNFPDMAAILAEMNEKFIETAHEKIARLNEILDICSNTGSCDPVLLQEFYREIHSLKGMGGTFQMPLVTKLCHSFENYLGAAPSLSSHQIKDCYQYIDQLSALIESGEAGEEAKAEQWLGNLPKKSEGAKETPKDSSQKKVMLICELPEMLEEIEPLFSQNGFQVLSSVSAFRGYKMAVLQKPEIIVVAQDLGEMDGAELLRSLAGMQAFAKTKMAMVCPDRRAALSENLHGIQLLSAKNVATDVMNFLAVALTA